MSKRNYAQSVKTSCLMCNTYAGCERHRLYKCRGCKLVFSWTFGAADDLPEHCDDCWAKAHCESTTDDPPFARRMEEA